MTYRLFSLLQQGWSPHTQTANPVLWHRRSFNKVADLLVNYTMDTGKDWVQTLEPPFSDFSTSMANFLCHTDGGSRQGSCSGISWCIEAIVRREGSIHTFPVARGGKFIRTPISSFTTEMLALDEAINVLSNLLMQSCSLSKRVRSGPLS